MSYGRIGDGGGGSRIGACDGVGFYYRVDEGGCGFGEVFGGGGGVFGDAFAGGGAEEEGDAESAAHFAEFEDEEAWAGEFASPFAEMEERIHHADAGAGGVDGLFDFGHEAVYVLGVEVGEVDVYAEEVSGRACPGVGGEAAERAPEIEEEDAARLGDCFGHAEGLLGRVGGICSEHAGKFALVPGVGVDFHARGSLGGDFKPCNGVENREGSCHRIGFFEIKVCNAKLHQKTILPTQRRRILPIRIN